MIIDIILDRMDDVKDGISISPERIADEARNLYRYATMFKFDYLSSALDGGSNSDIRSALRTYVSENGYGGIPGIYGFIESRDWIV